MLKKFFSNVLSSFMGAWIALMLFGVATAIVVFSIIAGMSDFKGETITRNSVMRLNLRGIINDYDRPGSFNFSMLMKNNEESTQSLTTIIKGLNEGANNKDIKCLYIKCDGVSASPASLNELRKAVCEFKKSGKKVLAYGDSYSQGDYYVASAADSVFLNGAGSVNLTGLSGQVLYLKDLFDKIGVTFQVFKVGTFKSAVEPYILNQMSEPARAQLDTLYGNLWAQIRTDIAASRKLNKDSINSLINNDVVMFKKANYALEHKLVDRIIYQHDINKILANVVGEDDPDDINVVSLETVVGSSQIQLDKNVDNQVAVLFAEGEITEQNNNGINCNTLVPIITDLADDDNVKAVVLRVNSPGGSVFGSEQIAKALDYVKQKGKPFIVSMGGYAASGGYWISCQADRIYSDPMTITGSIGIFGLMPNAEGLEQKIGVNPQTVSTNPNGMFAPPLTALNEAQCAALQAEIEQGYDYFLTRVAKGRKMTKSQVDKIGQGRVWDGATAKRLGLVDELGSLSDAVEYAAKLAKISGNETAVYYPKYDPNIWTMLSSANNQIQFMTIARTLAGQYTPEIIDMVHLILTRSSMQALMMPIKINM